MSRRIIGPKDFTVLMKARLRGATICADREARLRVHETPLFINRNPSLHMMWLRGEDTIGRKVDITIRRLRLHEDDRIVWDAYAVGPLYD